MKILDPQEQFTAGLILVGGILGLCLLVAEAVIGIAMLLGVQR